MTEVQICECQSCGHQMTQDEVDSEGLEVHDYWSRVQPGDIAPVCDCPECGSLMTPAGSGRSTIHDLPQFGLTENPTTCPNCGTRTAFTEAHGLQLHVCLNATCKMVFTASEDDEDEE